MTEPDRPRSALPLSAEFAEYMSSGWAPAAEPAERSEVAPYAAARRAALSAHFPGRRITVPAGSEVLRSNDTEYNFRPRSAFLHLTGLGAAAVPDSVLDLTPVDGGHQATLYVRAAAGPGTREMFTDAARGEFWIGPQPGLASLATAIELPTRDLADLPVPAEGDLIPGVRELDVALSELRLVKDDWEIGQLQAAVDATALGFGEIVRALPDAQKEPRGERVIEGAFGARARLDGNGVGYGSVVASGPHACILHWTRNNGPVQAGDLLLVDAGVELDSCYTADITRTLPVDGSFSDVQRQVYQAVLDAADAAMAIIAPGVNFGDVHQAAMAVIAQRLSDWGILTVPVAQSLQLDQQQHRRYMVHGTSHHLGLDVHDCAHARQEHYREGPLAAGMVLTVEPGLYFRADDHTVPAEFRGIGVRIEDDVLVTANGFRNLSAAIPRSVDDVEAWVRQP